MMESIVDRYPEISFLLACSPTLEIKERKTRAWKISPNLEGIEILYIYGVGTGEEYSEIKAWLHARRERALVYIEDDLSAIAARVTSDLWEDPQVHLHFRSGRKKWPTFCDELTSLYPTERIHFAAQEEKSRSKSGRIRLQLMRSSGVVSALLSEALFSHLLFDNLLPNFRRLPEAFFANALVGKFVDVPAIICGAGPSLNRDIPALKTMENRALIFAGGSAIAALSNQGIQPHFAMALDPNPEEYDRLKSACAFEVPFLYGNRLRAQVFDTFNAPLGYLKSDTGGLIETWFEDKLGIPQEAIGPDLGREAFSVTTLAVAYAYALGCNPIIFSGVDLAYTDQKRYASGVMSEPSFSPNPQQKKATEQVICRKDKFGKSVKTLVKWVMEADALSTYAKQHPERTFLNSSQGGLVIPGIPFVKLDEAVPERTYDLRGRVHAACTEAKMSIRKEEIETNLAYLKESLQRCLSLCEQILAELKPDKEETGRLVLLEYDLQEEEAYQSFLQVILAAFEKLFARSHPSPYHLSSAKWRHLKDSIQHILISL